MPEISLNPFTGAADRPAHRLDAGREERAEAAVRNIPEPTLPAVDVIRLRRLDRWRVRHTIWGGLVGNGHFGWDYEKLYQDLTAAPEIFGTPSTARERASNLSLKTVLDWSRAETKDASLPWHILESMPEVGFLSLAGQRYRRLPQALPPNLQELDAADSELQHVGTLPPSLRKLDIRATHVRKLKALPVNLECLHAGSNSITAVQAFPETLQTIDLAGNALQRLPPLPPALLVLNVMANRLTVLPKTPPDLQHLNANDNLLEHVPDFRQSSPLLLEVRMDGNRYLGTLPSFSDTLRFGTFLNCRIEKLPKTLPADLIELSLRRNPLGRALRFPDHATRLKTLDLGECHIEELSNLPASLLDLRLDHNLFGGRFDLPPHLTNLHTLNVKSCQLEEFGELPPALRRLDLSCNHLRAVPRDWLEASSALEIILRRNPIPEAEVEAVEALSEARRTAGLPTPSFVFSGNRARGDAFNLGNLGHTNAHHDRIVQIFRNRIAQLKQTQPRVFIDADFDPELLIEDIRRSFMDLPADVRTKTFAEIALQFFAEERETQWAEIDFQKVTPLMILAAVHRNIEALPIESQSAARQSLRRHLGFAAGSEDGTERCSTRYVEEVLSSFVPYQQYTPEVPWEAARDTMLGLGQNLARKLLAAPSSSSTDVLGDVGTKVRFQAAFQTELERDHPQISDKQRQRFLDEIMPHWDTFVEVTIQGAS